MKGNKQSGKANIVFFHIPKTAGSSFNMMLRENFKEAYLGFSAPNGSHAQGLKNFLALPLDQQNKFRCISGHMPIPFLKSVPWPFELITFMRHPVDRVMSLYHFYMNVDKHPSRKNFRASQISLLEFVENVIDPETSNGMTRRLSNTLGMCPEKMDETVLTWGV